MWSLAFARIECRYPIAGLGTRDVNVVRCNHSPLQRLNANLGQSLKLPFTHDCFSWDGSYYEATLSLRISISSSQIEKLDIVTYFLQGRVSESIELDPQLQEAL